MPKARGSSAVGAARDKGAILSRERMAPFDPQENGRGVSTSPLHPSRPKGRGFAPPFWIIHPSALPVSTTPTLDDSVSRVPAKAALLRSPHFNRKTTASAVVFVLFISSFQKIIDADAIKISERAQNVRRQHSFAAFIICVCALRNVDRFADLTLCQIGILPQIADAPVSLHVYHQTQYT